METLQERLLARSFGGWRIPLATGATGCCGARRHPASHTKDDAKNNGDLCSAFFTSTAVDAVPSGGVVLAYPYPDLASNVPYALQYRPIVSVMLDQAVSGMRFNLIGGFGWFPSSNGKGSTSYPAPLTPTSVQALFDSVYTGHAAEEQHDDGLAEISAEVPRSTRSLSCRYAICIMAFRPFDRSQPFSPAASWQR